MAMALAALQYFGSSKLEGYLMDESKTDQGRVYVRMIQAIAAKRGKRPSYLSRDCCMERERRIQHVKTASDSISFDGPWPIMTRTSKSVVIALNYRLVAKNGHSH